MDAEALSVGAAQEEAVLASIRALIDPFNAQRPGVVLGPGDDAAAMTFGADPVVMSTDTMSQDQDFRLDWWSDPAASAEDVGTKAAAQNLSDINAMGASARALLISLTLPPSTPVQWVQSFYRGVLRACAQPGADQCVIAGGDLGSGETISVTITALGTAPQGGGLLQRQGAKPGDVIAVSGQLGYAAAGLDLLERAADHGLAEHPEASLVAACLRAQRRPEPPLGTGAQALAAGATAGMDLSDGLLRDAARLAASSGVAIRLDDAVLGNISEQLIAAATVLDLAPEATIRWVLDGGEDYSLLASFPAGVVLPGGFRAVGSVEAGEPAVLTGYGENGSGWDSLRGA